MPATSHGDLNHLAIRLSAAADEETARRWTGGLRDLCGHHDTTPIWDALEEHELAGKSNRHLLAERLLALEDRFVEPIRERYGQAGVDRFVSPGRSSTTPAHSHPEQAASSSQDGPADNPANWILWGWDAGDLPDHEVLQFEAPVLRYAAVVERRPGGFAPVYCYRHLPGEEDEAEPEDTGVEGPGPSVRLSEAVAAVESRLGLRPLRLDEDLQSPQAWEPPPGHPAGWHERFNRMWWDEDRGGTFLALYDPAEPHPCGSPMGQQIARVWYNGVYFFVKYYGRRHGESLLSHIGNSRPRPSLSSAIAEIEDGRRLAFLTGSD